MKQKLPPGNFLKTTSFQFAIDEPVPPPSIFSPSLPPKSQEKPNTQAKRVQSAKHIQKKLSESKSSSNPLDTKIQPNYPKPVIRSEKPVTVKDILCEYEQNIGEQNMMPLKLDLKPHILQTISQQSQSRAGKALDLYSKTKAKTISEIRSQEKYKNKADSAVKVWLDQLEEEQSKQSKNFTKSFVAFQKAQARLDKELQFLMQKVQDTKLKNQEAFNTLSNVAVDLCKDNKDVNFSQFTLNNRPVKTAKQDVQIETIGVEYNKPSVYERKGRNQEPDPSPSAALISDDESFMNQISSPEDFEFLDIED